MICKVKFWTKGIYGNYHMTQRPVWQDNTWKAGYTLTVQPLPLVQRGSRNTLHQDKKKAGVNGAAKHRVPELGIISNYWKDEHSH